MTQTFRERLIRVLGRDLDPADEVARERLAIAEQRLGFTLPRAMSEFFLLAGAAGEYQEHDSLWAPEALEVEDGYLVFMEESQQVVDWGIPLPIDADSDPVVWQRVNSDQPEWYSEEMTFSEFIIKRLAWVRGVEL